MLRFQRWCSGAPAKREAPPRPAPPPRTIPPALVGAFTLEGEIPVLEHYCDDTVSKPLRWTRRSKWWNANKVRRRAERYYGETDRYLYESLDRYPVRDKRVVIVGSETPWYECICHCYGARVTTIEYRPVDCRIRQLRVLTWEEYREHPTRFDAVVSISSIEHDGLGRYGDPIDPRGDLEAMGQLAGLLERGGLLYLAVPIGRDALVWNAHRIYGRKRLPLLLDGWERVESFGFEESLFDAALGEYVQPVLVLRRA